MITNQLPQISFCACLSHYYLLLSPALFHSTFRYWWVGALRLNPNCRESIHFHSELYFPPLNSTGYDVIVECDNGWHNIWLLTQSMKNDLKLTWRKAKLFRLTIRTHRLSNLTCCCWCSSCCCCCCCFCCSCCSCGWW